MASYNSAALYRAVRPPVALGRSLTCSWLKMGDELAIMGMWWLPACEVTTWCGWWTPVPAADTSCLGPGELAAACSGTR